MLNRLREVLEGHTRLAPCATALDTLDRAVPVGTMRAWMQARDGQRVDTIQVTASGAWAPMGRVIESKTRTGSVRLDGSTRDYKGMRVLAATDDALIVEGDGVAIAYIVVKEA